MITIKNLTKKYGENVILENADYQFPSKGLVCLLGASGSGKSTLFNLIAGFDSDYQGELKVQGEALEAMNPKERCTYRQENIGFVFQNYHLLKGYTVLENILLAGELNGLTTAENAQRGEDLLATFGLIDKVNEKIEHLSGGQKQRVALARALLNQPRIILADEPTGALDRQNSTEVMKLFKELSKEHLVLVITHDPKNCEYADEVIQLVEGQIVVQESKQVETAMSEDKGVSLGVGTPNTLQLAKKNFQVNLLKYLGISFAISLSIFIFMLSLSTSNGMKQFILDFQEKNTAFNNGSIQGEDKEGVLTLLQSDSRIKNSYYQYKLTDITLIYGQKEEQLLEKYPMAKATEKMSYGVMPRAGKKEIALSPSLAKKLNPEINQLIGQKLTLVYQDQKIELEISGIFNAIFDDFFVSSEIEQSFYAGFESEKNLAISYDIAKFEDISPVTQMLKEKGIVSQTAVKEVETLQQTFQNVTRLFLLVSSLILALGFFVSYVLIKKIQQARYKEIGLFAALGYNQSMLWKILFRESLMLVVVSLGIQGLLLGMTYLLRPIFSLNVSLTFAQVSLSLLATGLTVCSLNLWSSRKLIKTEVSQALRM